MIKRPYYFICILCLMAAGCTKDFHIDIVKTKPLYVIDGRISNMQGPYYVRITKATDPIASQVSAPSGLDNAEAVTGAQVIIADDMGIADTLMPADQSEPRYDPSFSADRGYYVTRKITGIPGHTYQIQVNIGNEVFQAAAYMPSSVPSIDSVLLKKDPINDPSGVLGYAAFTSFKEPQDETDYYLLQLNNIGDSSYDMAHGFYSGTSIFPFYVFDDTKLSAYVEGIEVLTVLSDAFGYRRLGPYWVPPDNPVQVRLSALTRETYEYFNALEKQFLDDGNVYTPTPASAVGNISGGALGLFWAGNISYKASLQ